MDYFIENWVSTMECTKLLERIRERDVYIYGAYSNGKYVKKKLEEHGIYVKAYIDGHKEEETYDNLPLLKFGRQHIHRNDCYIIVAVNRVRDEILECLYQNGFKDQEDFLYISKDIPKYTLIKVSGYYKDIYNNEVIVSGEVNAIIEIVGWNNRIEIGKRFICGEKSYIRASFGAHIVIGNYVNLGSGGEIEATQGQLTIGPNCQIDRDFRICQKGADVTLGDYLSVGKRFLCLGGKTASVTVGVDCMISNDVSLIASGGHSLFDLSEGKSISQANEKYVKIGNHVWIGQGASVLHNSEISEGCVVGANSLVKCKSEKNTILAGNPATVIRKNCTWDRQLSIEYSDL